MFGASGPEATAGAAERTASSLKDAVALLESADGAAAHLYLPTDGRPSSYPATILSYVTAHARQHSADPYLTLVSGRDVTTVTYGELEVRTRVLAAYLRRTTGIGPGDVVALVPTTDIASVLTLIAVLRAGCSLLLLNPSDPPERHRQQCEMASPAVVLRGRGTADTGIREAIEAPVVSPELDVADLDALPEVDPSSPALLFSTSGSTAAGKIVVQSHQNVAVNAHAVQAHHGFGRRDRMLGCLPLHHVNGVHFTLFATLAAGAHAVIVDSFDPFSYFDVVQRFRPRIASVVPTILESLIDASRPGVVPGDFEYFVSAAAPLDVRTAKAVARTFGVRVQQGYGLTETTNFSTTLPAVMSDAAYRRLVLDADIPSVGIALYGNELVVLREDGTPAHLGEVGEICMRGHNVMLGYLDNPGATAEAFRGGWFHSQDLGFEASDPETHQRFFVITGRLKNIAKVGGEAVSLEEMERTLRSLPLVADAACVTRPHRVLGDEIVAAIVTSDEIPIDDVRAHLRRTFAAAALPRTVVRLDRIPRTPTGKIRRRELAELVSGHAGRFPA